MKKITQIIILLLSAYGFTQSVSTFTNGTPDDGIALDSNGNIYCSNYTGDTVFKFTPSGSVTSFITGVNTPNGIAFNSNEELYVCDGAGSTIYKYDSSGNQLESYPVTGHPSGIIKSRNSESMIFTIYTSNKVMNLAPDGTITELVSGSPLNGPVGLTYDDNDVLYIANYNDRKIYKIENNNLQYIAQVPASGSNPYLGFITYGQGKLWGTVLGAHKIYTIDPNTTDSVVLFAGNTEGNTDDDISTANFNQPNGILFNNLNNTLYVTDFGSKNLRIISGISLSIHEESLINRSLSLSPNPAKEFLNIKIEGLTGSSSYSLMIYNFLGETIFYEKNITTSSFSKKINTSAWNSGMYFVKVVSANGFLQTKKFIKK
jgi:sugar lactone lactonase YvrE